MIFTPPMLGLIKPETWHILTEDGEAIDTESDLPLSQEAAP